MCVCTVCTISLRIGAPNTAGSSTCNKRDIINLIRITNHRRDNHWKQSRKTTAGRRPHLRHSSSVKALHSHKRSCCGHFILLSKFKLQKFYLKFYYLYAIGDEHSFCTPPWRRRPGVAISFRHGEITVLLSTMVDRTGSDIWPAGSTAHVDCSKHNAEVREKSLTHNIQNFYTEFTFMLHSVLCLVGN